MNSVSYSEQVKRKILKGLRRQWQQALGTDTNDTKDIYGSPEHSDLESSFSDASDVQSGRVQEMFKMILRLKVFTSHNKNAFHQLYKRCCSKQG